MYIYSRHFYAGDIIVSDQFTRGRGQKLPLRHEGRGRGRGQGGDNTTDIQGTTSHSTGSRDLGQIRFHNTFVTRDSNFASSPNPVESSLQASRDAHTRFQNVQHNPPNLPEGPMHQQPSLGETPTTSRFGHRAPDSFSQEEVIHQQLIENYQQSYRLLDRNSNTQYLPDAVINVIRQTHQIDADRLSSYASQQANDSQTTTEGQISSVEVPEHTYLDRRRGSSGQFHLNENFAQMSLNDAFRRAQAAFGANSQNDISVTFTNENSEIQQPENTTHNDEVPDNRNISQDFYIPRSTSPQPMEHTRTSSITDNQASSSKKPQNSQDAYIHKTIRGIKRSSQNDSSRVSKRRSTDENLSVESPRGINLDHKGVSSNNRDISQNSSIGSRDHLHFRPSQFREFIKNHPIKDDSYSPFKIPAFGERETTPEMRNSIDFLSDRINRISGDFGRYMEGSQRVLRDVQRAKGDGQLFPHGLDEATRDLKLRLEEAIQFRRGVKNQYEDPIDDLSESIDESESNLNEEIKQLQSEFWSKRDSEIQRIRGQNRDAHERQQYLQKRENVLTWEGDAHAEQYDLSWQLQRKKSDRSLAPSDQAASFDEDIKNLEKELELADAAFQNAKNERMLLSTCQEKRDLDRVVKEIKDETEEVRKKCDKDFNKEKKKIKNKEEKETLRPLLKKKWYLLAEYDLKQKIAYDNLHSVSNFVVKMCDNIRSYQDRISRIRDDNLRVFLSNPDNPIGLALDNLETVWQNAIHMQELGNRLDRAVTNVTTHIENVIRAAENPFPSDAVAVNLTALTTANQQLGQMIKAHMDAILQRQNDQGNDGKGKAKA